MGELGPIWEPSVLGELQGAFGTRMAGDGLLAWANRWLVVRAGECSRAREHGTQLAASPCSASTRDRFQATLYAFRTPHLRAGLRFVSVIAELPAPEYCAEHPEFGHGTWRVRGILRAKFSALLAMKRYDDASAIGRVLLRVSEDKADWRHYFEDTLWIAGGYAKGNQDHRADLVLRAGLKMALEHQRPDEVEMLEASLAELNL